MATGSLQVNRDIIIATKKQHLKQQMKYTPTGAVLALAQMQKRPRSLLNYSSDPGDITLIAQISRHEVYDPVTAALHCLVNGADAISFFTDHSIYHNDLDDLLMLARAIPKIPVLFQNYTLTEYEVMAARASDASAVMLYSTLVDEAQLRKNVSTAQRWKMSTVIQVGNEDDLQNALALSPHAISFGDNLSSNVSMTVNDLLAVQDMLPPYIKICLTHTLRSIDDIVTALKANVDAIMVDEDLLKHERSAAEVRALVQEASRARVQGQ